VQWLEILHCWNGRSIITVPLNVVIDTDSSNFGWGARIGVICAGANWSKEIKKLHINMKELIAVLYGIKSLKEKLKGKKICI
jgi:hypothetical protein